MKSGHNSYASINVQQLIEETYTAVPCIDLCRILMSSFNGNGLEIDFGCTELGGLGFSLIMETYEIEMDLRRNS